MNAPRVGPPIRGGTVTGSSGRRLASGVTGATPSSPAARSTSAAPRLPGGGQLGGQRGRGGLAGGEDEVEHFAAGGAGDGLPQLILGRRQVAVPGLRTAWRHS